MSATSPSGGPTSRAVTIVTPMFNDWEAAHQLLSDLDAVAEKLGPPLSVVVVNDGSTERGQFEPAFVRTLGHLREVELLHLVTNVGHAQAIALGLAYVAREKHGEAVVVMDSDGEDRPGDVPRLLDSLRADASRVTVAHREKRSETLGFRAFYRLYKVLFWLLTGRAISFGNFCVVPWPVLQRLVFLPDLFNHLAACLVRSRFPIVKLATARGTRYAGRSKMNLSALIQLGLGAIAVDLERVLVRILMALGVFCALLVMGMGIVAGIRFATDLAIPGWATNIFGILTILLVQSTVVAALLLFIDLKNRTAAVMVPALRYRDFLAAVERVKD